MTLKYFVERNIKSYLRDRVVVFFSMLSVIILYGIFFLFLGDNYTKGIGFEGSSVIINSWLISGSIACGSLTTAVGSYTIIVDDKDKKRIKDFYASPISYYTISASYILSGFIVSVVMSLLTLGLGIVLFSIKGGVLLDFNSFLESLPIIVLICFNSSAFACLLISFVKTHSALSIVGSLTGTFVGFITGSYVAVGSLPKLAASLMNIIPLTHGASLLRKVFMQKAIEEKMAKAPLDVILEFRKTMGIDLYFRNHLITTNIQILILVITGILFYYLAVLKIIKSRQDI